MTLAFLLAHDCPSPARQRLPILRDANRLLFVLLAICWPALADADQQCIPNVPRTTPTARFALHADGTATDRRTGLTWRRCAEGQRWQGGRCTGDAMIVTWDDAMARFGRADTAGWRLPSLKELASIAELACRDPAINPEVFPDTPMEDLFWSASTDASSSARAWTLYFRAGFIHAWTKVGRVRLVRAGQ